MQYTIPRSKLLIKLYDVIRLVRTKIIQCIKRVTHILLASPADRIHANMFATANQTTRQSLV